MSDKCYLGVVLICVCLIMDHVVSDHFRKVMLMDKVILFVLNLFLHLSLPHYVNSFYSANTTKFPVDNRGPRVARFQLDSVLPWSPGIFLGPAR